MQNIQEYFSQLSVRDRILLVFAVILIIFVFFKVFLIDSLNEKNTKLIKKSVTISQQQASLNMFSANTDGSTTGSSSNQIVSAFLKQKNASKTLKQIRTTNDGAQRFEIEGIEFTILVQLLSSLDEKSLNYSNLQIKKTKLSGVVDATLTML